MNKTTQPLSGLKILDLSRILAGPWATQTLADFGAEVWKIEHPVKGDDTRNWGPPFIESNGEKDAGYFVSANRNKLSVALDITTNSGQQTIRQLAKEADVVIENFKVGGLKKYGLDYESVKSIKDDIVYLSITGFGQTGPNAHKAGYDAMIQASAGLMSLTGNLESEQVGESSKSEPVKVGVAVADLMTGMYAVSAILAAIYRRDRDQVGSYIDLALYDTQVAWLANQATNYCLTGESPKRMGSAHPNIAPYQAFATKDGHFMLAVGNDSQFEKCCKAIGAGFLTTDDRFASNNNRVKHRKQLNQVLQTIFDGQSSQFWLDTLESVGVPCGPINNLKQVFQGEQVASRHLLHKVKNSANIEVPIVANPVKFSDFVPVYTAPPLLGEHTELVLKKVLGLSNSEIQQIVSKSTTPK